MKLILKIFSGLHLLILILGILHILINSEYIDGIKLIYIGLAGSILGYGIVSIYLKEGRMPNISFLMTLTIYGLCLLSLIYPKLLKEHWNVLLGLSLFNLMYFSYELTHLKMNIIPQERLIFIMSSFFAVFPFIMGLHNSIYYTISFVLLSLLSVLMFAKIALIILKKRPKSN